MSDNNESEVIVREVELNPEMQMNAALGHQEVEDDLTQLQFFIEAGEWDEAELRMKSHPEEIVGLTSTTALHLALEGGETPFPLIKAMIEMEPMLVSLLDKNGNTPLHIACAGEFAYDPLVIATLLAAYPQATLLQDRVDRNTPLGMLLCLGGDINITCVTLLLDVAYSRVAGLPVSYVLAVEFMTSSLDTSLPIAEHYPPLLTQVARQMAISDPYGFPAFMRPFLHLPPPQSLITPPRLMEHQPKLLTIQDSMKQVPLHFATRRSLDKEVVALLLAEERYPGAHQACHILERKDRFPLLYCALYNAPTDAAELVFEQNKDAIHAFEQYGLTPYQGCANCPHYTLQERSFRLKASRKDPSEPMQDLFMDQNAWTLYQQLTFYLRLTYQNSASCETFSVNHAAAAVVSTPHFMRCSIKLYPWQLSEHDEDGNLPLHLACKVLRPHGINDKFYWLKKDVAYDFLYFRLLPEDRATDNPITILTEAYPKSASTLDRDGNLPIHSAILSGKQMIDGIRSLIQAAPMTLSTRNAEHRLYPFMLAAMIGDVNLTLELLLANPTMINVGHHPTTELSVKRARLS
jgi:ankyrin repeat protein